MLVSICDDEAATQRWAAALWTSCVHRSRDCSGCLAAKDCRWCSTGAVCLPEVQGWHRRRRSSSVPASCWVACLKDTALWNCQPGEQECGDGAAVPLHWLWVLISVAILVPCGCLIVFCCYGKHRNLCRLCLCCARKSYVVPEDNPPRATSPRHTTRNLHRSTAQAGSRADMRHFLDTLHPPDQPIARSATDPPVPADALPAIRCCSVWWLVSCVCVR